MLFVAAAVGGAVGFDGRRRLPIEALELVLDTSVENTLTAPDKVKLCAQELLKLSQVSATHLLGGAAVIIWALTQQVITQQVMVPGSRGQAVGSRQLSWTRAVGAFSTGATPWHASTH